MRTFLACCGIDGDTQALVRLKHIAAERRPDALLFAGSLFAPRPANESPVDAADRHHFEISCLDSFFATLGRLESIVVVIPGPHDAPLPAFLRAGLHAASQHPGVHVVHAMPAIHDDVALCGIGGIVTEAEDSAQPVVRCARATADYFLRPLALAEQSQKVLLFAVPPRGDLGGDSGNDVVTEMIDTYHPKLAVVAGESTRRGCERVAHTTIVNPGRLSHGSAAWIDWGRAVDEQVEFFDVA